ncbi:MAG TPA: reverse transcriptase-like protein [Gemmataceae bacterium]|nr:reverse transcriptase-like protein [Gemmataceae bacterium]
MVDTARPAKPPRDLVLAFDGSCAGNGTPDAEGGFGWECSDRHIGEVVGCGSGTVAGAAVTNNAAEWAALVAGLTWLRDLRPRPNSVRVQGDSRLVVEQLAGQWKAKAAHLADATAADLEPVVRLWFRRAWMGHHCGRCGMSVPLLTTWENDPDRPSSIVVFPTCPDPACGGKTLIARNRKAVSGQGPHLVGSHNLR